MSVGRAALIPILILVVSSAILTASVFTASGLRYWLGGELSAWVQAVGAILAIVSGFAAAAYQTRMRQRALQQERAGLAKAAHMLAFEALETISDRLDAALTPKTSTKVYALRGGRTTEMVRAMSEFDTARLPTEMLSDFIRLRSHVFAINERIAEIYASEEKASAAQKSAIKRERHERLRSSVRIRADAVGLFEALQAVAVTKFGAAQMPINTRPNLLGYEAQPLGIELADR